jgi:hypothetical protein
VAELVDAQGIGTKSARFAGLNFVPVVATRIRAAGPSKARPSGETAAFHAKKSRLHCLLGALVAELVDAQG